MNTVDNVLRGLGYALDEIRTDTGAIRYVRDDSVFEWADVKRGRSGKGTDRYSISFAHPESGIVTRFERELSKHLCSQD